MPLDVLLLLILLRLLLHVLIEVVISTLLVHWLSLTVALLRDLAIVGHTLVVTGSSCPFVHLNVVQLDLPDVSIRNGRVAVDVLVHLILYFDEGFLTLFAIL